MPKYASMPNSQPGYSPTGPIVGSPQQQVIWDAFRNSKKHLVVKALAGTGKTFTGVEGLRPTVASGRTAAYLAFNKSIATELASKVPQGAKAQTFHGAGYGACRNQFGNLEVDADRVYKMLPSNMPRHAKSTILKLVSLCKNVLVDGRNKDELLDLCALYDIDLYGDAGNQGGWGDETADLILTSIPKILEQCKTPTGTIDFDDMIWLPVIWNLPIKKFDVLVVDESQDLNACQMELAFMIGRQIIIFGDEKQAIYHFRGASSRAMAELEQRLADSPQGVEVFPLTVTRRCPRLVTALAKEIVPEFECLPDAKPGTVCLGDSYLELDPSGEYAYKRIPYPEESHEVHATPLGSPAESPIYVSEAGFCREPTPQRGDMVLCRVNAPLVQMAYQLIRTNTPCKIQGRDFGKGLETLIKTLVPQTATVPDLMRALVAYEAKERAKIEAAADGHQARMELQLGNLQDKVDCIEALCENLSTAAEVVSRIQLLFQDVNKTNGDSGNYVLLSSVHRAKGLESRVVRIIHPELLPHPMAHTPEQREQEKNLKYVAITRSLDVLHIHD